MWPLGADSKIAVLPAVRSPGRGEIRLSQTGLILEFERKVIQDREVAVSSVMISATIEELTIDGWDMYRLVQRGSTDTDWILHFFDGLRDADGHVYGGPASFRAFWPTRRVPRQRSGDSLEAMGLIPTLTIVGLWPRPVLRFEWTTRTA